MPASRPKRKASIPPGMSRNIFIGSLSYKTTEEELAAFFGTCGTVAHVKILVDRDTAHSRGFGFIEMSTDAETKTAIAKLNGSQLGGRKIFVSEAKPQDERVGEPAAKPGFVERRSGKDRRQTRQAAVEPKKQWEKRSASDSGSKDARDKKREKPGGKRKWAPKPGRPDKRRPWALQPPGRFVKKDCSPSKEWGRKPDK